jgi:hypothetical protein
VVKHHAAISEGTHRCIHGSRATLRCLVQGKRPVLLYYLDDSSLHKLVETRQLLIYETFVEKETVDDDPQLVFAERHCALIHVDVLRLRYDVEVALWPVQLTAGRSVFITIVACADITYQSEHEMSRGGVRACKARGSKPIV